MEHETGDILDKKEINVIQQIVGTFLYYAIAIDNTILLALSDLSAEQSIATARKYKLFSHLED